MCHVYSPSTCFGETFLMRKRHGGTTYRKSFVLSFTQPREFSVASLAVANQHNTYASTTTHAIFWYIESGCIRTRKYCQEVVHIVEAQVFLLTLTIVQLQPLHIHRPFRDYMTNVYTDHDGHVYHVDTIPVVHLVVQSWVTMLSCCCNGRLSMLFTTFWGLSQYDLSITKHTSYGQPEAAARPNGSN